MQSLSFWLLLPCTHINKFEKKNACICALNTHPHMHCINKYNNKMSTPKQCNFMSIYIQLKIVLRAHARLQNKNKIYVQFDRMHANNFCCWCYCWAFSAICSWLVGCCCSFIRVHNSFVDFFLAGNDSYFFFCFATDCFLFRFYMVWFGFFHWFFFFFLLFWVNVRACSWFPAKLEKPILNPAWLPFAQDYRMQTQSAQMHVYFPSNFYWSIRKYLFQYEKPKRNEPNQIDLMSIKMCAWL